MAIAVHSGRRRAQRLYPHVGLCEMCGKARAERHHRNSDTLDNSPENIGFLCRRCHMAEDGRLEALAKLASIRIADVTAAAATARRARTHCKRGHPLCGENLRINTSGSRICRTCEQEMRRLREEHTK